MNWRQSAKASEKIIHAQEETIQDLLYYKQMATHDIKEYNSCILSMISGGSPCEWCNDQDECQRQEKEASKGCEDWLLVFRDNIPEPEQETVPIQIDSFGGDAVES